MSRKTKRNPHTGQKVRDLDALIDADLAAKPAMKRHVMDRDHMDGARAYIAAIVNREKKEGKAILALSAIAEGIEKHFGEKISANAVRNYMRREYPDHWKATRG